MREEVTTETLAVARSSSALTPARRRTAIATRMLAALDKRVDDLMTSLHEVTGGARKDGRRHAESHRAHARPGAAHRRPLAARTAVEEVHTGLEHVMRAYLGRRAAGMRAIHRTLAALNR
jgi:hypothetical protein